MYGFIGSMITHDGQRDALIDILINSVAGMPGCLSYIVAADRSDPNKIWVTEVWERQADHAAALQLPGVQAAMAHGRPLIAGFGERIEIDPRGGHGI